MGGWNQGDLTREEQGGLEGSRALAGAPRTRAKPAQSAREKNGEKRAKAWEATRETHRQTIKGKGKAISIW